MSADRFTRQDEQIVQEILDSLLSAGTPQGLELELTLKLRDGYKTAAQTLASIICRQYQVNRHDLLQAIISVTAQQQALSQPPQGLALARLQLEGCRALCERLLALGEEHGAERAQLLAAVQASVEMRLKLDRSHTVEDMGLEAA